MNGSNLSAIVVFVIPGLIVGLTAGISYDSYSDENYCLLRHSNENNIPMLYFAFYLPIGRFVEMSREPFYWL